MSDILTRLRAPMNRDEFFKVANGLCMDAAIEIDRLTRELAEARDKALEEAAKVAEKSGRAEDIQLGNENAIADAIRALKEKP